MKAKSKRLLSLLLAMMLLVGMIPLNASAAGDEKIDVKVSLVEVEPKILNKNTGAVSTNNLKSYVQDGFYDADSEANGTPQQLAAAFEKANNIVKPATSTTIPSTAGSKFYLAVKFDTSNIKAVTGNNNIKGIRTMVAYIQIPDNTFEANGSFLLHPGATGLMVNMESNWDDGYLPYFGQNALKSSGLAKDRYVASDASQTKIPTISITIANDSDPSSGKVYNYPEGTTWDVLVPLKVKAGATAGTKEIKFIEENLGPAPSSVGYVESESGASNFAGTSSVNYSKMKGDALTLTLESNDPAITPAKDKIGVMGTDQTREITLTVGKMKAAASLDKTKWTLESAATGGSPISGLEVKDVERVDDTHVKVTVGPTSGADYTTEGDFYICATADQFAKADASGSPEPAAVSAKVTTKAIPAATTNYTFGYQTGTGSTPGLAATNPNEVSYRVKGQSDWTALTDTNVADLEEALLTALNGDGSAKTVNDAIEIAFTSDVTAGYDAATLVSVSQLAAPSAPTIKYDDETTNETYDNTVMYGFGATEDAASFSAGSSAALPLAVDTNGGTNLYVYTKGTASGVRSTAKSVAIPARPAAAGGSADADADGSIAEAGQTKITGAATGTWYWVDSSNSKPSTIPGSGTAALPDDGLIDAKQGQYIHLYVPSATAAFHSAFQNPIPGKGNDYGTVTASGESEGNTIRGRYLGLQCGEQDLHAG